MTTASGTVNYTFDVRNRLDKVIENGVVTADYDYDAVNNLIRTTLANGTQEIRTFDDLNRLRYLENRRGNSILSSYTYTLDLVGNRTRVVENTGRVVDYTYDDLYRLNEERITDAVNGNRVYGYTYDKVGNRLNKTEIVNGVTTTTSYEYDANDRLLNEKVNQQVVVSYTYDNQGNTLTKAENGITTEYTWDFENRLIAARVRNAGGVIQQQMQYRYNDNGIRVASTVNGVETRYLVDDVQPYAQVLEEYRPSGAVQVEYVYGNDLIVQEQVNSRTFYHVDGLGSTRVLTDAQGSVVSTYNYEAYGELINSTGGVENKYLFAGEQFDSALGDYYNRARYYDADTGRFTRRDDYEGRLGEPLTLHKYMYAHDNPVNFTDPSGLSITMADINAALTAIGILANSYGFATNINAAFNADNNTERFKYSLDAGLNLIGLIIPFIGLGGSLASGVDEAVAYSASIVKPAASILIPVGQQVAAGLVFMASRGHEADWELINSQGEVMDRGKEFSGMDTPPGRKLTWNEQLLVHTERKILSKLENQIKKGDVIMMRGTKVPCIVNGRGCQPAMQEFAKKHGVTVIYEQVGTEQRWVFK